MRVLVTGATSLLGRTVALTLARRGDAVTCFQRSASDTGLAEYRGDVRDAAALLEAARDHDAVVHLAALVAPRPRWDEAYAVNVTGTRNAQSAASRCGRFVHVSTPSVAFAGVAAVGAGAEPPTYAGRDAYAHSKAIAEREVLERADVPTVVIRPHLVWGPGDTQLVARVVARSRQHRLFVPDAGLALVDTTFVDDAADAIVASLDHALVGDEACAKAWVVTGADPRPVGELLSGILRAAGRPGPVRSIPAPVAAYVGRLADAFWPGSEPPITHFAARQLSLAHWFDQREVQHVLGWTPKIRVEEGLARLAEWFARDD